MSPLVVRESGIADLLEADLVTAGRATNKESGNEIDFFLVSRCLRERCSEAATAHDGCAFSPHLPVTIELELPRDDGNERRLWQPRLLPVDRPIGPLPPVREEVDWDAWQTGCELDDLNDFNADLMTRAVVTWTAGLEVELMGALGIHEDDQEHYMGLGLPPKIVKAPANGRFASVHDDLGLTGQRMSWALRGLRWLELASTADHDSPRLDECIDAVHRVSNRARAYKRELRNWSYRQGEEPFREELLKVLVFLGRLNRWTRGPPPRYLPPPRGRGAARSPTGYGAGARPDDEPDGADQTQEEGSLQGIPPMGQDRPAQGGTPRHQAPELHSD